LGVFNLISLAFIYDWLLSFIPLYKSGQERMRCETISDTIEIQKIDSVYINNEWVKYVTKFDTIVRYNEVFVPKTRYQIKTEYKLKRDSIEVIKYKTKIEYKTIKKKWNFPIKILIICFAIGFVIALLKVYIKK
jgi:hypothetical protein